MRREGGSQRRRVWTRFEATCAWCGRVPIVAEELGVFVGAVDRDALFEFRCPECERVNVRGLPRDDVATLLSVGIEPSTGPAPFELLEHHDGPAIDWDDIIDLHQALTEAA
jgi:hypothetical protein